MHSFLATNKKSTVNSHFISVLSAIKKMLFAIISLLSTFKILPATVKIPLSTFKLALSVNT